MSEGAHEHWGNPMDPMIDLGPVPDGWPCQSWNTQLDINLFKTWEINEFEVFFDIEVGHTVMTVMVTVANGSVECDTLDRLWDLHEDCEGTQLTSEQWDLGEKVAAYLQERYADDPAFFDHWVVRILDTGEALQKAAPEWSEF